MTGEKEQAFTPAKMRDLRIKMLKEKWPRQRKLKAGEARDPGPHGKTRELLIEGIRMQYGNAKPRPDEVRDRSLRGKARRKARKAKNAGW